VERLRILQLKAARGWSRQQAAHAFLINEQTLRSWLFRVDEQGERALIQTADPVNKFPDFVRYLVKQLKALLPTMGKVHLAQLLARAGLHLGATTIARILNETEPLPDDAFGAAPEINVISTGVVTATYPGHTWHIDLTAVPTWSGFWVPWIPFALPQSWPFCWWVAVAIDHFSRAVVGFSVFFKRPTSAEVQRFLDRAIHRTGRPPKYVITDKGTQFWCKSFKRWCRRKSIRPRFGAVGKFGSIAVVERFMRSMKNECTRRILVPFSSRWGWMLCDANSLSMFIGTTNTDRAWRSAGARLVKSTMRFVPRIRSQGSSRDRDGQSGVPARHHKQQSREHAARSSVLLSATWRAENICPSLSRVAQPDQKSRIGVKPSRGRGVLHRVHTMGLPPRTINIRSRRSSSCSKRTSMAPKMGVLNSLAYFTGRSRSHVVEMREGAGCILITLTTVELVTAEREAVVQAVRLGPGQLHDPFQIGRTLSISPSLTTK
jgi:transposase InsO family protein